MAEFFFTNAVALSGGLTGPERFPLDTAAGASEAATAAQIRAFVLAGQLPVGQYAVQASAVSFTAGAGEVCGAQETVLDLTGALAGAGNITTPTAVAIFAALSGAVVGTNWVLRILNNSAGAFAWTLVGGVGVTVLGTATVAQNTWREWLATFTSPVALTMQNMGAGDV